MTERSKSKLTAADIMKRDLVVTYEHDTLQDAMTLMTENHVTGLPVVNSKGTCIGIISATDILNYEQEHAEETNEANDDVARLFNPDTQQWESVRVGSFALEQFGSLSVSEVMARELIFVSTSTPLKEVAKKMVDEQIHRVLVLNSERGLQGIISATDFVQLFAE